MLVLYLRSVRLDLWLDKCEQIAIFAYTMQAILNDRAKKFKYIANHHQSAADSIQFRFATKQLSYLDAIVKFIAVEFHVVIRRNNNSPGRVSCRCIAIKRKQIVTHRNDSNHQDLARMFANRYIDQDL
jgi:hypothetical protein